MPDLWIRLLVLERVVDLPTLPAPSYVVIKLFSYRFLTSVEEGLQACKVLDLHGAASSKMNSEEKKLSLLRFTRPRVNLHSGKSFHVCMFNTNPEGAVFTQIIKCFIFYFTLELLLSSYRSLSER